MVPYRRVIDRVGSLACHLMLSLETGAFLTTKRALDLRFDHPAHPIIARCAFFWGCMHFIQWIGVAGNEISYKLTLPPKREALLLFL